MSATPSNSAAGLTGDAVIDAMTTGYKWTLGADRTIDWSISGGLSGEQWGSLEAAAITRIGGVLDSFAQYADIHFHYVGSFASPAAAASAGSQINVFYDTANRVFSDPNVLGLAAFPATKYNEIYYPGAPGDVVLNFRGVAGQFPSYEPGSEGGKLLLHEIGHALGLKHPHDDAGTGHPTFSQAGLGDLDSDATTIMSYEDTNLANLIAAHPATPMVLDVLALQAMYGPNTKDNSGDGAYTLASDKLWITLFTAGGVDTLNAASENVGWTIILPEQSLSTIVPTKIGMAAPSSDFYARTPATFRWLLGDMENVDGSRAGDQIRGNGLANRLNGGAGNDTIEGGAGQDYIRGDDGNDSILGGDGFDDINGNKGNDVAYGGEGDDWVVGGQDQDLLYGENGFDIVYGNLGNDTLFGGNGVDWVRGGQGDDIVDGGAGNDWLWGDRGNDTITGGAGADLFHFFSGAGVDRVTDFKYSEGDRVILDDRTAFTLTQVGADAVITVGGVDQVILAGVQASSLAADAITYA